MNILENLPSTQLIQENKLEGLFFKYYPHLLDQTLITQFKTRWKQQWMINFLYLEELTALLQLCKQHKINPIVLKGAALLSDIYFDYGSRHLSDIDLLVNHADWPSLKQILQQFDYHQVKEDKWEGNEHKFSVSKLKRGTELVIEVHSQLFYHCTLPPMTTFTIDNIPRLNHEWFLLHMCGHYAFQHTFLKLYWAFDLHLFIIKYQAEINWQLLRTLAEQTQLTRALSACCYLLRTYFATPIPSSIVPPPCLLRLLISKKFLWEKKQNSLSYYLIKHLVKDSSLLALSYDLLWLRQKISIYRKRKNSKPAINESPTNR